MSALLLVPMILVGCSGSTSRPAQPSQTLDSPGMLVGSAGERLVRVRAGGRLAPAKGSWGSPFADLVSLAHDPSSGTFYGLAQAEHNVVLVAFVGTKPKELRTIGPLTGEGFTIRIAEAITWDAKGGRLLVAASRTRHTPISNLLFAVDPSTAEAVLLARIAGSEQNEADALAMVGNDLLMVDNVVGRARLFRLDVATGAATPLGGSFEPMVDELAWDPESGRLFGLARREGRLLALEPDHRAAPRVTVLSDYTLPQGEDLSTLASASRRGHSPSAGWVASAQPPPQGTTDLFADSFEDGTAATWSRNESLGASPPSDGEEATSAETVGNEAGEEEATGPEVFEDDFESGSADDWNATEGEERPAEPPPSGG